MKNIILKNSILLVLVFIAFGQQYAVLSQTSQQAEIPTVTFCDLIRDREKYTDKTVRLRAVYRFGFEWSDIYCLECLGVEKSSTWLEFADETCDGSKKIKGNGDAGKTVKVQVVGKFFTGGGFGHLGGYPNKFVVSCVEKVKIIAKDSSVPQALPVNIREKTNCCNSDF